MKRYLACFTLVCFLMAFVMIPQASANLAGQQIASAISSFIGSYGYQWTANNLRDSGATEALARDIDKYIKSAGISDSAKDWLNFGTDVFYRQPGQFVFNHTAARKAAEFVGWFTAKYGLEEPASTAVIQENDVLANVDGRSLYGSDVEREVFHVINSSETRLWFCSKGYLEVTSITKPWNPDSTEDYQTVRFAVGAFLADGTLVDVTNMSMVCYHAPDFADWYVNQFAHNNPAGSDAYVPQLNMQVRFNGVSKYGDYRQAGVIGLTAEQAAMFGIDVGYTGELSVTAPAETSAPPVETMTTEQSLVVDTGIDSQSIDELVTAINALIASNAQTKTEYIIIDKAFSEDEIIDGLTWRERLAEIGDDIRALPGDFADAIAGVFVPDAALTQEISATFTNKFGFLPTIHQVGTDLLSMDADTSPPVIYIHLEDAEGRFVYGGTEKALDMAWYQRYKASGDAIISGFLWLGFLWMVFKRASAIIQGGEMVSEIAPDIGRGYRKRGE